MSLTNKIHPSNMSVELTSIVDVEAPQEKKKIGGKSPYLAVASERNNILQFDITFTVPGNKDKGVKTIVHRVADLVTSGQTLAIMGPSGAGKTTLLKALTLEAHGGVTTGSLTLNGTPLTASRFSRRCALVAQEDHHWAFLTCRETISFAADLYMSASAEEKKREVDSMIQKMGLESCADTIVGNQFMKGLSGGQMRRLSLAVILMKKLDVVILDEPTSGLDAASAASIMSFISELTKSEGLITIYTIHQPSTTIYNTFDRIMLLTDGRIAYTGTREDVLPYLARIGRPVPEQTNPAEFMLDLVNKDFSDAKQVNAVLEAWQKSGVSDHQRRMAGTIAGFDVAQSTRGYEYSVGLFTQVVTMFRRHGLLALRDPMLYSGRIVMFLLCTVFFAIIYVRARARNQEQALQRMWYVIWIVGVPSNMGVVAVYAYNTEFNAIKREVKNGMLSPIPYLLANSVLLIPVMFLLAIAAISVGGYGIIDFNGERYGEVMLIYACMMYAFESLAQMLSVAFDNPLMGMLNFMQLWFSSFLFSGLFITIKDIVWPFRVFSYILPFRYAAEALIYQEFIAKPFRGAELCDPSEAGCLSFPDEQGANDGWRCTEDLGSDGVCYGRDGWQVLKTVGQSFDVISADTVTWVNIVILLAIAVGARLVYVVLMLQKSNNASKIVPLKDAPTVAEEAKESQ
jgi:ABC-type multidrug transport system ATPase subunit